MDDIKTVSPGRRAAFISLCKMRAGKYTNLEVGTVLSRMQLSEADRGLYTALVYGVTERLITLDYMIAALSKRVLSALDEEVLCALRLGLYQLAFMDRIPPHAAVSQSVALTPAKGRGFVNALLHLSEAEVRFLCQRRMGQKLCLYDILFPFPFVMHL